MPGRELIGQRAIAMLVLQWSALSSALCVTECSFSLARCRSASGGHAARRVSRERELVALCALPKAVSWAQRAECRRCAPAIAMQSDPDDGIELPLLLATDVTLIFAFACARTLSQILLSPSFPGWSAPVAVEPGRLAATFGFAGACSVLWCAAGLVTRGYSIPANAYADAASTTMARTVACFVGFYTLLGAVGFPATPLSIDQVGAAVGLALGLAAWRWSYADSGYQ